MGMKELMDDVRAFHEATDTPALDEPKFPDADRLNLRGRLLYEEVNEYFTARNDRDLVAFADALTDIIYVAVGTALECGIPLHDCWDAVHLSNLAKVDPTTKKVLKRPDGKVIKPEGWKPPDIEGALSVNKIKRRYTLDGEDENE